MSAVKTTWQKFVSNWKSNLFCVAICATDYNFKFLHFQDSGFYLRTVLSFMIESIVLPAPFAILFQRSVLLQKCCSCYLSALHDSYRKQMHAMLCSNLPDQKSETYLQLGNRQLNLVHYSPDDFSNDNLQQNLFDHFN